MPKSLTQYRIFIGSPGGLERERKGFRDELHRFSTVHAEPRGATFHPVGWEDVPGGAGRPQAIINEELKQCDYAVFVLHDRWGTETGSGYSAGTEEEWELTEALYKEAKIRNIALFFKKVAPSQLRDPGDQLKKVLSFKSKIEKEKKYLFTTYARTAEFCEAFEGYLAKWLRDHEGSPSSGLASVNLAAVAPVAPSTGAGPAASTPAAAPSFDYWIAEANQLLEAGAGDTRNYSGALFCADKAVEAAGSDIEWARARNLLGTIHFHSNNLTESITAFAEIAERFEDASDSERQQWQARSLFNKGVTLGQLGRRGEEIAVYDDVLARFGTATELSLREPAAKALVNKGVALGQLGRNEEEITVYDDVVGRFGTATELSLRGQVALALFNKGVRLGQLGRSDDAITAYDGVVGRFSTATELPLREQVVKALVYKGITFGQLGRNEDKIKIYDDVVGRFGSAEEPTIKELVDRARRLRAAPQAAGPSAKPGQKRPK